MINIYFSSVFGLPLRFLTHNSQSPWNFLSVESGRGSFCCINEVTFGWLPVEPIVWLGYKFQPHPLGLQEGERDWRLSSVSSDQWFGQSCPCNEASTNSKGQCWWNEEIRGQCWVWFPLRRHGSSLALPYVCLPLGCAWVTSFCFWAKGVCSPMSIKAQSNISKFAANNVKVCF